MRINNNMSAVITNKQLLRTENNLTKSMERLSSGLKINHAKDNPAGMAISNKMQAQIDALDRASSNASDGTSVLQIADGALNETSAILQRMRELSVQAANGTNSLEDKQAIQDEIEALKDEAMNLFLQEEALIEKNFPDDALARSANLYEQGYVSMKLHDLPLAEKNMLSALDFAKKSNDLTSIGCAYRGLGEILKASEKVEDAAVYFEKAITAFQKAGDTYGVEEVKELMSK